MADGAAKRLRSLVAGPELVVMPDVHDVLVARMAAARGFPALYVGSLGLSNSRFGIPDQSLLGIDQLVEQARLVASAVDVPVCVDLEDGGGNAVIAHRNVRAAEQAGCAAIQIEDHVPGKAYGRGGALHPVAVAATKVRAATEARRDPDTVIIGRTEALYVQSTEQEALDRAGAYVEAGADMITVSLLPPERVATFARELGVPIANFVFGDSVAELQAAGLGVAIYAAHSLVAHYRAADAWLERLATTGRSHPPEHLWPVVSAINELVGGASDAALAERYGIIPAEGPSRS